MNKFILFHTWDFCCVKGACLFQAWHLVHGEPLSQGLRNSVAVLLCFPPFLLDVVGNSDYQEDYEETSQPDADDLNRTVEKGLFYNCIILAIIGSHASYVCTMNVNGGVCGALHF